MKDLKTTKSICPECFKVIDATIFERDGDVYMGKDCAEHGHFEELYWSDVDEYRRAQRYALTGEGPACPQTRAEKGHPFDCGLCPAHKSSTSLAIIDVTNRCNLRCPICFANANVAGYVYEPSLSQIDGMIHMLRDAKPMPAAALQLSGGEPTVRDELPEIVRMAKRAGFDHIEINSNGIKMSESVELCRELAKAGVSTVYLQFDGLRRDIYLKTRGRDLLDVKMKALENLREAGLDSVVLVPTIVKGLNDDQLGPIVDFAVKNFDIVRCVNFQPVSITGRIDEGARKEMRITIPDCMRLIEEQTKGGIKRSDFYPVPVVVPISRAIGAMKNKRYSEFTVHEHCGMATFLIVKDGDYSPITRHANIEKFVESMGEVQEKASKGHRRLAQAQLASSSLRYIEVGLLRKLAGAVFGEASYDALGSFMRQVLMVGMMHFQDPYNFDLERVERCGIHYAVPDGRVIPFCTMNTIYRSEVEKKFSVPTKDWKPETGEKESEKPEKKETAAEKKK